MLFFRMFSIYIGPLRSRRWLWEGPIQELKYCARDVDRTVPVDRSIYRTVPVDSQLELMKQQTQRSDVATVKYTKYKIYLNVV